MPIATILWIIFGALPIALGITYAYLRFLNKISKTDTYYVKDKSNIL